MSYNLNNFNSMIYITLFNIKIQLQAELKNQIQKYDSYLFLLRNSFIILIYICSRCCK